MMTNCTIEFLNVCGDNNSSTILGFLSFSHIHFSYNQAFGLHLLKY